MTINVAHGESQIFGLSGAGEESLRSVGWKMMDRGRSLGWEGGWMMWRRLAGEEKVDRWGEERKRIPPKDYGESARARK
jgi:hypothetical protein